MYVWYFFSICFFCFINYSSQLENSDEINPESINYDTIFQDIFNLHHAVMPNRYLWQFGKVFFKLDPDFSHSETDIILQAMYEIEKSSCIRFRAHNSSFGPNYVKIIKDKKGKGCVTRGLGFKKNEVRLLSLSRQCVNVGVIIHELLHAIGFAHHHCRANRDQQFEVHFENIKEDKKHNFKKIMISDYQIDYLTPIDGDSIMNYGNYFFSKNGLQTLAYRNDQMQIQNLKGPSRKTSLSHYDKVLLNWFYRCKKSGKRQESLLFYSNEFGLNYPMQVKYSEVMRAQHEENKEIDESSDLKFNDINNS